MEVCVIGSLNEEIMLGPLSGWPAWGKQVFVDSILRRKAGSAAAVALPLAKLGTMTGVLGVVGDDENSILIQQRLSKAGVNTKGIARIKGKPTGLCVSIFRPDAERAYISALASLTDFKSSHLKQKESYLSAAKIVLLTGCFITPGISFKGWYQFFRRCRRRGQIVCLDTGWDPRGWPARTLTDLRRILSKVDVFLPNEDEARIISGRQNLDRAVRQLWSFGPERVYVKRGNKGCMGGRAGEITRQKGFPVKAKDVTAAGEAFNAGIIYGLSRGMRDRQIMRWANALAALVISKAGGEYPTLSEVKKVTGKESQSK
ncbi:MAG: putative sugar kinase YdjH [candidate division WS2 bacterium]|nr:putative sugar kinase YdjH [Candidatus Psychracetigena formicireducens]